jgi:hypothetical protein
MLQRQVASAAAWPLSAVAAAVDSAVTKLVRPDARTLADVDALGGIRP